MPSRWQRLVQFRLRTLLILTTIIAVWFAWWSHRAREQRRAVAALTSLAGVEYDFQEPPIYVAPSLPVPKTPPGWPEWLVQSIGIDYFANVTNVYFLDTATDSSLRELNGLRTLKRLGLMDTQVTDAGISQLPNLVAIHELDLSSTHITDAGLANLKNIRGLRSLHLGYTKLHDVGLAHIVQVNELDELTLAGTCITDAGLEHLKRLASLRHLALADTNVTDAGVERLQKALPNCNISH